MAAVTPTGDTLIRKPDTFGMGNPTGYFRSEIIRKLNDDKDMDGWNCYHDSNNRSTSGIPGPVPPPPNGPGPAFPGHLCRLLNTA